MLSKKIFSLTAFLCAVCYVAASESDRPVIRLDFSEPSRKDAEVLEPGYTNWGVAKDCKSETKTFDGIEISVASDHNMRCGWNKAFVQAGVENSRLTGDGLSFENKEDEGYITMSIKGLPAGVHTIQIYHNSWQDPTVTASIPIHIFCNDEAVGTVKRTFRETTAANAAIFTHSFSVADESESVVFKFVTDMEDDFDDPVAMASMTKYDLAPLLNGFELNTVSVTAQAKMPSPADADMHIDADNGSFLMKWSPANKDVRFHHLYIGTSLEEVTAASKSTDGIYLGAKEYADTTHFIDNLYCLNTYYWRVDEEDANGVVTPGNVWSFRPRKLAFPDAEGYGRYATGGRGGDVYHVTNLNAGGEGSLAYGINTATGPRTIVFDVSGIIVLGGRLTCSAPYVTIAGQTAPGHGICLADAPFGVGDESIVRFVRLRLGLGEIIDDEGHRRTADGIGMAGADHSILDHASISWTIDEAFSSRNAHNMTLQRTMIAEALGIAGHKNYDVGKNHGFAATIGGDIASFHHNLLIHCNGRNWSLGGGLDGNGYYSGRLDIFNNVVYNWGGRATDGGAHEVNFVNNYYKMGPAGNTTTMLLNAQLEGTGKGTQAYYVSGNVRQARNNGALTYDSEGNTYKYSLSSGQVLDWDVWVEEPFFPSYAKVESAKDAYKSVMSDVGATMPFFDLHDQRMIREALNATYTYTGSLSGVKGQIDSQEDCGGYEVYPEVYRPESYDTDRDGMPDWWEELVGSDASVPNNNDDPDHDGYTLLENFLEWMAHTQVALPVGHKDTIDLSLLFKGYTQQPVYSIVAKDGSAEANVSGSSLLIEGKEKGLTGIRIQVKDAEGSTFERLVNVSVTAPDAIPGLSFEKGFRIEHFVVFDLKGQQIWEGDGHGCSVYGLNLSGIPSGVYVIRAYASTGEAQAFKVIK